MVIKIIYCLNKMKTVEVPFNKLQHIIEVNVCENLSRFIKPEGM